eukprot:GEMP01032422.1.p1 GENE.GEMP01032422.1~~GEMP01032422.1.p1  ORF type:complete len:394 (+),score=92.36 GEMP01032422.1:406-1587(+)
MGNEPSSDSPNSSDVTLHLNDIRNVPYEPDEHVIAWVQQRNHENIFLSPTTPAELRVSRSSVLRIGVWTQKRGDHDEPVSHGSVHIPIDIMMEKSGAALYHTWFLLEPAGESSRDLREMFEYSLYEVVRESFRPKICLTLVRRDEELRDGLFRPASAERVKADRYAPLLLSHLQHLQLCQTLSATLESPEMKGEKQKEKNKALKTQVKALQAENENLMQMMDDLQRRHRLSTDHQSQRTRVLEGQITRLHEDHDRISDISHSRRSQELVESLTQEANQRIDQANEAIHKLRARLTEKIAEVDAHKEEAREHENEVKVLREQKTALMKIVEDLYTATAFQTTEQAIRDNIVPSAASIGNALQQGRESLPAPGTEDLLRGLSELRATGDDNTYRS